MHKAAATKLGLRVEDTAMTMLGGGKRINLAGMLKLRTPWSLAFYAEVIDLRSAHVNRSVSTFAP